MHPSLDQVQKLLRDELKKAAGPPGENIPIMLERPKEAGHGDIATNLALLLAPRLKKSPREIAQTLVAALSLPEDILEEVEVAGPGFINFTLSRSFLRRGLRELLRCDESFGKLTTGQGKRAQVEFVSANPTGPLTVGHGRQAVLGDAVARILENASYAVEREYYFNDAGKQIRLLGQSIKAQYLRLSGEDASIPEGGYQGDYVEGLARRFMEKRGSLSPPPAEEEFTVFGREEAFAGIKRTLFRLGIHFDRYYSERSLFDSGRIENTIHALRAAGLAYDKDEALWLAGSTLGLDQDWVMVKSTGEPTYRLPDIAYHIHKLEQGYDLIVDVFGADHQATYPVVLAAVSSLGHDASSIEVLIHQFVTVKRGGREVKMSKRKGDFLTLDSLIDEVGTDAVRYFYLLRVRNSHLAFDVDLAVKESEENPVFYVQYAHARTAGILRHAKERGFSEPGMDCDADLLGEGEELALIRQLLVFPEVAAQVLKTLEPQRITVYLREVATAFHQFYQHHRVIGDEPALSRARLSLVKACRTVLSRGLGLLGVSAPDRM